MDELSALTEAECYARCYGEPGARPVHVKRCDRPASGLQSEPVLQAFEERREAREPEAA